MCLITAYLIVHYRNLTLNTELIFFLGEPLPVLNMLLHLWFTNPRVCIIVQLSLFNSGYLLLKGQISLSPNQHLPFKHLTSQRTAQNIKTSRKHLELAQYGSQENKC